MLDGRLRLCKGTAILANLSPCKVARVVNVTVLDVSDHAEAKVGNVIILALAAAGTFSGRTHGGTSADSTGGESSTVP